VVVEAGVVAAHPRDDPDVDVAVAPQLLEAAAVGVDADQVPPRTRRRGDLGDEPAQLGAIEVMVEPELGQGWSRPQRDLLKADGRLREPIQ